MPRRLTPKSTLENLKREAKRWLKALRAPAGDVQAHARKRLEQAMPDAPATPSLRDVQHALAREHGFSGWAELTRRVAEAGADSDTANATRQRYETMAQHLLEAYRTGEPAAMEHHWNDTWHRRTWQTMRTYVQLGLGKRPAVPGGDVEITLDDARLLVAREHGFGSWHDLAQHAASATVGRTLAMSPVTAFMSDSGGEQREQVSSRDWDTVLGVMAERGLTGLHAHGQMTDDVLARVADLEHISVLKLDGSKQLTDAGVRHIARLRHLRELDLSGCAITDASLAVLGELAALERLGLARTAVTDSGAAHLATCDRLERVNLAGTATGDSAIAALAGKSRLHDMRTGNGVTNAGLALFHRFPVFKTWQGGDISMALTSYDAEPNYLAPRGPFTDSGLGQLVGLAGLFALNVDNLAVSAAGLEPLVGLANLGWLAFDATDAAMPYVAAMPRLRFLGCQDTVAGDDGFVALSRSQSIEYIWGRRCYNLGARGFTALASMPALRGLSVSCKNVDDAGLSALPNFPALAELMPMDVPDDGFRHVGRCERLESLVLMYCRETGDVATQHIVGLPRLRHYFASYTRITDRSLEILGRMAALERIELVGCAGVTNAGISALASLPRLRELRLAGMHQVTDAVSALFPPAVRVSVER